MLAYSLREICKCSLHLLMIAPDPLVLTLPNPGVFAPKTNIFSHLLWSKKKCFDPISRSPSLPVPRSSRKQNGCPAGQLCLFFSLGRPGKGPRCSRECWVLGASALQVEAERVLFEALIHQTFGHFWVKSHDTDRSFP